MKIVRVTRESERAGAYYVRIATMMREQGFKKAVISSRVGLEGFYEKMGYRFNESGKAHHDTFECVYMEKVL